LLIVLKFASRAERRRGGSRQRDFRVRAVSSRSAGRRSFRADKQGVFIPVASGRARSTLCVLVERHGDLVSKDEIITAVWPGIVVADSSLPIQIDALSRQQLY